MLINAPDPRQWTYLRNLPQKKKTLVLTLGSPPEKGGEKKTNPGQVQRLHSEPAGKGREEKNPGINPGQVRHLLSELAKKGWEKKKKRKKNPGINPG
jgi:hypothetical protein